MAIFPLRYWCYKVLPLVYDDSLSYYELLNKVVAKLNEVIGNVNLYGENVEALVDKILKEWAESGEFAKLIQQYGLFGNEMNLEYLSTLILPDSRYTSNNGDYNYEIIEGCCFLPNGNLAVVRIDAEGKTDTQKVEIFTKNGISTGVSALVECGHGNDITCDGNYLYICWAQLNTDSSVISNKVTRVNLDLSGYQIMTLPVAQARTFQYDKENDNFVSVIGNNMSIISKDLSTVIRSVTLDDSAVFDHNKYPNQVRQHCCVYGGMIIECYSYPGVIAFYNMTTGKLVKVFNIPDHTYNGFSTRECEGLSYNESDGFFYGTAFARCGAGDICSNVFFRTNFSANAISGNPKYATRTNLRVECYVDPTVDANSFQTGTVSKPFKYLQSAVDYSKINPWCDWIIVKSNPDDLNLGCVQAMNVNNLWITHIDEETDVAETVPKIIIRDCSNVKIFLMNVGDVDVDFTSGFHMVNCKVNGLLHFNRLTPFYLTSNTLKDVNITSSLGCIYNNTISGTFTKEGLFLAPLDDD